MERSNSHRFSKNNRLLDAASFSRVFDKATRSRDKWFTVLCRHNDLGIARLGLAISKKHCKRAVDRNRIKRIVRESFRRHGEELQGIDLVVMNKVPASDAANNELQRSLEEHWRRCGNVSKAGNN